MARKSRNFIAFFALIVVINFILGYDNKNVNAAQMKDSYKIIAQGIKKDELNKNTLKPKGTKINNEEEDNLDKKNTEKSRMDSQEKKVAPKIDKNELKAEVERIYNERSAAFVSGDVSALGVLFDTSQKYGQWTLENEIKRVKYLNDWANERNITFGKVESMVRIKKIYPRGQIVKIALEESYKFDYVYNNDENPSINSFGVGIRHTTSLIKKNEKWVIYSDWFTDCFEDALRKYSFNAPNLLADTYSINDINTTFEAISYGKGGYDRQKAVAYADKYCGAAWGSGNNFKYNKKYNDYNGVGGDCTNFASQVLGDKEGGGLPIGGEWTPGDRAWANADGLKDYLIYSGRGSIIGVGTFKQLTKPSEKFPNGIAGKLQLGDLVAYEKGRGNIDHFAVVTGFDSHGYPLINSHTTDRYHVPWDLGWGDDRIRFFLIHVNR